MERVACSIAPPRKSFPSLVGDVERWTSAERVPNEGPDRVDASGGAGASTDEPERLPLAAGAGLVARIF